MKFWHTLQQLKNKSHSSWLAISVLVALIISLSLGQLGRQYLGNVVLYPHDVLISVWLLIEYKTVAAHFRSLFLNVTKNYLSEYLLVAWTLVGMLAAFALTKDFLPWLYAVRLTIYILFLVCAFTKFRKFSTILKAAGITIGAVMLQAGFIQYFFVPDTRFLFFSGWDEHYYRLIGTLLDPNYTGLILIVVAWAVFSLRNSLSRAVVTATIGLMLIGIGLTFSRASYLALIVSIIGYVLLQWWKSRKVSSVGMLAVSGIVCVVGAAIILAPKPGGEGVDLLRTTSITARYTTSAEFLEILQPWQWITGAGFYTLPTEIHDITSHAKVPDNIVVLLLYSTGIIGTLLAFWSVIKVCKKLAATHSAVLPIALAVFTHAQFNNSLLEPFVFLTTGIVLIGLIADKND